jgi:putative transposase
LSLTPNGILVDKRNANGFYSFCYFLSYQLTLKVIFVRLTYLKRGRISMLKAYKYRIFPTAAQQMLLAKHFGCVRHVYNWALEQKIKSYQQTGKSLAKRELQNRLVQLKKTEKPWLNEVNSQSLLAALLHVESAYQHFFQGRAGFPTFKKKYDGHQSFQCPQHVTVNFSAGYVNLPKIKHIKTKFHRVFSGDIKTVTIKKVPSGKYFVSILVENHELLPVVAAIESEKTIGIDMGLTHYLIDSTGKKMDHPSCLRQSLVQLKKVQRQLSRKQDKSTKNRAKQREIVASVHEKVANQRHDFIHQRSAELVFKNHATSFAVEDLHIKGMVKNRKLSRAIADSGWRKFITALTYKCEWSGKNLLTIDRFAASSKTCHVCGVKRKELPLLVREWQCECGALHDRDINAARNIRAFALADALGHSVCVKQSPCS